MKTFAEFFAGVGLVREGLATESWSCLWANDISQDKRDTYIKNFGNDHFRLGDIWDMANHCDQVPDNVFLYTASFPCTDLSLAGGRAGLAGKESGALNALFTILKAKHKTGSHPKVIMLENVKGFLNSHQGKDISDTVRKFSELGYVVDILEVDAVKFTPQSRPRIFIIAVEQTLAPLVMKLKSEHSADTYWWSLFNQEPELRSKKIKEIILRNENLHWGLFEISPAATDVRKLSDIIDLTITNESSLWWNEDRQQHLFNQMSDLHKNTLETMIQDENFSYGTVYRRTRKGKSMAELRTDGIAGCLRTPRGGSSKQILIKAGRGDWQVRLLTPREYARLQGVRDDFILPDNMNQGYFAMGDAVCVPVIKFLSKNILTPIYQTWTECTSKEVYRHAV